MLAFVQLLGILVLDLFKSRSRLEVENLFHRHQLRWQRRTLGRLASLIETCKLIGVDPPAYPFVR